MKEIELFIKWLESNAKLFNYPPIITKENDDEILFLFDGLIPNVVCNLSKNFIDIWYKHAENKIDLLFEIDMPTIEFAKDSLYYCSVCKSPHYYQSENELYENHTFKPLLEWVNKINPQDKARIMGCLQYGFFSVELGYPNKDSTYKGIKPIYVPIVTK